MAIGQPSAYASAMQAWLVYALYAVIGVVFIILAVGVINLVRTDDKARSRSNKLMRLRVLVQFIAIIILVLIGVMAGAFR
jgi:formate hydrogenlyase subunit 3/multisubunit Na+/H+ antiporter MnhD subunit